MTTKNLLFRISLLGLICFFLLLTTVQAETVRLLDLDFKNADIRDVLRTLANQEGASFIIDNDLSGLVTIHLARVTFTDALNTLAKEYNLVCTKENRIYYISRYELLKVDYTAGLLSVEARDARLKTLLELISQKSEARLVPAPELSERITIVLNQTPLTDGIQTILTQANCVEEKIGSVTFIKKRATDNPFKVTYESDRLTVDAQNIPLPALTREITEKTGISVVPDQTLAPTINIYLQGMALPDALQLLCESNGLQLLKEGPAYRIVRKAGSYRIKIKDGLLSVDIEAADVASVLNEVARQSGYNIILARDVQGPITAHFQEIPFFQGLTAMLESRGLSLEKQADYYYVKTNPNVNPNMRIVYDPEKKLYDLEIQTAPVATIINEMARKANLNLVIMAQVNWTVNNLRLQKLSFTQALDFLLKGTVFTYKLIDDTYLVGDGMVIRPENADFAVIKVYPIKYLKADQFLNTLPPLFPKQNFILVADRNALIVTAPPATHALFSNYLEQMDIESTDNRTEVIKIKYLKAEDVLKLIPPSIPKNDLVVIKEANAITVTGPQNLINQVRQYISRIDEVNPMIVFDVLVVQISDSKGLTWKAPSGMIKMPDGNYLNVTPGDPSLSIIEPGQPGSTTTGDTTSTTPIADKTLATLTALVQKGTAKVIANPTVSTLNGYPASFSVSTKWSFTIPTETTTVDSSTSTTNQVVKTLDSGLDLKITPWVSSDNQITMEIRPKISEFGDAPSGSILPSTSDRSTETTVRVNNRQTIIISGLKNTRKQKTVAKVPLLGDIPLLGYLFRNYVNTETQDEFIIMITPYLVFNEADRLAADEMIFKRYSLGINAATGKEETGTQKKSTAHKEQK